MRSLRILVVLMILILGSGCAAKFSYIYPENDLKSILAERLSDTQYKSMTHPFEANEEMRIFARRITMTARSTKSKCRRLVEGILNKSQLNVQYSRYQTKTAIELFYEGEGNCLAYTNLFISLARSIGLRALFADASLLINDMEEKEGVIVNNGHICAVVYSEPDFIFVDFSNKLLKHMVGYSFIDDIEGIAHYYNNLGYEMRAVAQSEQPKNLNRVGIHEFEMSVAVCPDFYRGFNNLGVVYQQLEDLDNAILNYQRAIDINPDFSSAYGNLGMLHFKKKDYKQAHRYFKKAISFNQKNHFNYYYLGMIELKRNNLREAKRHFQRALRLKKDFTIVHFYLSKVYQLLDEPEKARKEMEKAQLSTQK